MAWTTPIEVSDVRTEYPLLTSDLCADARVTANRDRAEAEVEAVLRDRYELDESGPRRQVRVARLPGADALPLFEFGVCRTRVGGTKGGLALVRIGTIGETFKQDIGRGVIKLSLQVASTVPTPTVGNFPGKSPYSRFGLDANAEYGFPKTNED